MISLERKLERLMTWTSPTHPNVPQSLAMRTLGPGTVVCKDRATITTDSSGPGSDGLFCGLSRASQKREDSLARLEVFRKRRRAELAAEAVKEVMVLVNPPGLGL
jgi:transcription initiation factor TFIID subunit TAF12